MADTQDFKQVVNDAILDADSLERFINGSDSETVLTRLSAEYPTLQKAIKEMFENGGLPATPFKTKAEMEASSLDNGSYAFVTNDTSDKNGLYVSNNGSWSKSSYNVLSADSKEAKHIVRQVMRMDSVGRDAIISTLNLYRKGVYYHIGAYIGDDGTNISSQSHAISTSIPVLPNTDYTVSQKVSDQGYVGNIGFYDIDAQFISRTNTTTALRNNGRESFKTPDGAYFVRLSVFNALDIENAEIMFYEGDRFLSYRPYSTNKINPDAIDDRLYSYDYLEQKLSVDKDKLIDALLKTIDSSIVGEEAITQSRNLLDVFNPSEVNKHVAADGSETARGGINISQYIPVKPDATYTLSQIVSTQSYAGIVSFYDAEKDFIGRVNLTDPARDNGYATATTPSNATYARVNYTTLLLSDGIDESQIMFYEGSDNIPYEAYKPKSLNTDFIDDGLFTAEGFSTKFNPKERELLSGYLADLLEPFFIKVSGGNKSYNLFNEHGNLTSGRYLNNEDMEVSASGFFYTDFIVVEPDEDYTAYQESSTQIHFHRVSFYDIGKNFISAESVGTTIRGSNYVTVKTPKNCFYVRLSMQSVSAELDNMMFYKGSDRKEYSEYIYSATTVGGSGSGRRGDDISFTGDKHPSILLDFPDSFTKDDERNIAIGAQPVTYEDMVSWWQDLVDEFPDYITKEKIGVDASGLYDVHCYTFSPDKELQSEQPNHPLGSFARPKVLLLVQHIEQLNQLYPLLAMREMCRNWDKNPALAALRFQVEFKVIPYAHPWGFTYANVPDGSYRMTSAGLNTNGDWVYKWVHTESPKNGNAPFATQEARNVKAVVEGFRPHVLFDLHSAFANETRTGVWIDAELNPRYVNSVRNAMTQQYADWKKLYPDTPDFSKHMRTTYSNANRQAPGYGYAMGCVGGLIEFMKGFNNRPPENGLYNDGLIYASSGLLNIITQCIAEYRDYGFPNPYPLYNGNGVYDPENGIGI